MVKWHTPDSKDVDVQKDDDDGATRIRVPISSTGKDRDGDKFTRDGLDDLKAQLESEEVPLYLDHGLSGETGWREYRVEDMIGGWVGGEIEERDSGNDVLFGIARLEPGNEKAEMLENKVENDLPIGYSVGFIPDLDQAREMDDGGLKFNASDLLETSAVGIPSNPDAVAAGYAVAKALDDEGIEPTDIDRSFIKRMVDETNDETPDEVDDANEAEETEPEESNDEVEELVEMLGQEMESRLDAHRETLLSEIDDMLDNDEDGDEEEEEADYGDEDDEDDEKSPELNLDELKSELIQEAKQELLDEDLDPEDPKGIVTTDTETNGNSGSAARQRWGM
ncbi:hypothetical protein AArcMg_1490 [Natrarchaeobaculum sulfurireducens]|uniref:Uncharacterized protein n=1 Tax=Natrarchaeobaculum sulfurireducens TaxID=2044521 RepID=A0A346PPQ8_9EURY|nr:hypothetical protein AArcMg_1490 [Natrarchaeobaculum sulfurireducens]